MLRQACPLCLAMYVSVIGTFLVSAGAAGPLRALASGMAKDLSGLRGSPTAALLAAIWLVGSAGLVLAFPKDQGAQGAGGTQAAAAAPAVPVETLSPEQLNELHAWLERQPTVPETMPQGNIKVLLIKFNDYQCPSCRQAHVLYKDIIASMRRPIPVYSSS